MQTINHGNENGQMKDWRMKEDQKVQHAPKKSIFQIDLPPAQEPIDPNRETPLGTLGQMWNKNGNLSFRQGSRGSFLKGSQLMKRGIVPEIDKRGFSTQRGTPRLRMTPQLERKQTAETLPTLGQFHYGLPSKYQTISKHSNLDTHAQKMLYGKKRPAKESVHQMNTLEQSEKLRALQDLLKNNINSAVQKSENLVPKAPFQTIDNRAEGRQEIQRQHTMMSEYKGLSSRKDNIKKQLHTFQNLSDSENDDDLGQVTFKEEKSDKLLQFENSLLRGRKQQGKRSQTLTGQEYPRNIEGTLKLPELLVSQKSKESLLASSQSQQSISALGGAVGQKSVAIGVGSQIIAGDISASAHKQIYTQKQQPLQQPVNNQYRMFNPTVQLNQSIRTYENAESKIVYQDPTTNTHSSKERYVSNEGNRSQTRIDSKLKNQNGNGSFNSERKALNSSYHSPDMLEKVKVQDQFIAQKSHNSNKLVTQNTLDLGIKRQLDQNNRHNSKTQMYQGASQRVPADRRLITPLLSAGSSSSAVHHEQKAAGRNKDVYQVQLVNNDTHHQQSKNVHLTGSTNGNRLPQRHVPQNANANTKNVVSQRVEAGIESIDFEINGRLPDKIPRHDTIGNNPRLSLETQIQLQQRQMRKRAQEKEAQALQVQQEQTRLDKSKDFLSKVFVDKTSKESLRLPQQTEYASGNDQRIQQKQSQMYGHAPPNQNQSQKQGNLINSSSQQYQQMHSVRTEGRQKQSQFSNLDYGSSTSQQQQQRTVQNGALTMNVLDRNAVNQKKKLLEHKQQYNQLNAGGNTKNRQIMMAPNNINNTNAAATSQVYMLENRNNAVGEGGGATQAKRAANLLNHSAETRRVQGAAELAGIPSGGLDLLFLQGEKQNGRLLPDSSKNFKELETWSMLSLFSGSNHWGGNDGDQDQDQDQDQLSISNDSDSDHSQARRRNNRLANNDNQSGGSSVDGSDSQDSSNQNVGLRGTVSSVSNSGGGQTVQQQQRTTTRGGGSTMSSKKRKKTKRKNQKTKQQIDNFKNTTTSADQQKQPGVQGVGGEKGGLILSKRAVREHDEFYLLKGETHLDPLQHSILKVDEFIQQNPINPIFIRREKARLPYSVFKPSSGQVYFLKSIFEGRPPTAFFHYPNYINFQRQCDRIRVYPKEEIEFLFMSFRISDNTHIYNAVVNSCKHAGFIMVETGNPYFNIQWTGYIGPQDIKHLNKYQKSNHFPGSSQLGRKDLLWRNMNRLRLKFPSEFAIAPISYLLSEDMDAFQTERESDPDALWILKPVAASCGRGIKIVTHNQRVNKKEGILASKYIANPHLINGLKYDLRMYVLVTNFNPLKVYLYNDGLVRFATEKYSTDPRLLTKKYVHLTNFSVNKKNTNFVKNTDKNNKHPTPKNQNDDHDRNAADSTSDNEDDTISSSSKWDFKMLKQAYERQNVEYGTVWANFQDVIIKTLISVEPHITNNLNKNPTSRNTCFEIYGFDIIVDAKLKPWVLEVNVLPSLSSSSPFDKRVKTMMVCDALTMVGVRGYDKRKFHAQSTELLGLAPFVSSQPVNQLRQMGLTGKEHLSKDELEMLMDLDEEFMRRGNFKRIFPLSSNVAYYEPFFESRRYQNVLTMAYLQAPHEVQQKLLSKHRRVYFSEV